MTHEAHVVACDASAGGWHCRVVIGEDAGATEHDVTVDREDLADLAPGATPEALVAESFRFLLEREARESILRSFTLPTIGRYFADYPVEMRGRLSR